MKIGAQIFEHDLLEIFRRAGQRQQRSVGYLQPLIGQVEHAPLEIVGEVFQDVGLLQRTATGLAGRLQLMARRAVDAIPVCYQFGGHAANRAGDDVAIVIIAGRLGQHLHAVPFHKRGLVVGIVQPTYPSRAR